MVLSDVAIRRPVLATVANLLLLAFGVMAFTRLQVREYPDIEPPVISIETVYPGAAAAVVERSVTQLLEDRMAGVEGIRNIESSSADGVSRITIEFLTGRDIEAAANDVREVISGVLSDLPEEVRVPEVTKQDIATEVLMWLNLASDRLTAVELADYAERYLVDGFSQLPGVARIRISGATRYAMRIWLDREALAARRLTVLDVEDALRKQNVELPAGAVQSLDRSLTVRVQREYTTPEAFESLVVWRGADGYQVRLGEVAMVEQGAEDARRRFHGNGVPMVALGIIKQSQANALDVSRAARAHAQKIRPTLPEGMALEQSYDTSQFIEASISEVFKTLGVAASLVVLVIYLFLGSGRATLVPVVAVPVSVIATCIVAHAVGFSVNVLTLLAMVLAIGLVVDDAIVMLENIHRRMEEGESALVAAFRGARQVGFAVVATTMVLVAVFLPITFLEGDLGRLFGEFAVTLAAAVVFSSFVALTACPMTASWVLRKSDRRNFVTRGVDALFRRLRTGYEWLLRRAIGQAAAVFVFLVSCMALTVWLQRRLPSEFTPREDRGSFFIVSTLPEGASFGLAMEVFEEVERRLLYLLDTGDATRVLVRVPRAFGVSVDFNEVISIVNLADFGTRRPAWEVMDEVRGKLADMKGVRQFVIMRQALSRGLTKPVQFVIGGPTYEELVEWRDKVMERARENPGLIGLDYDYRETKPQLSVEIDRQRAADLGVSLANVGRTLEVMLGFKRVTTYVDSGEEYDVILEGDYEGKRTPTDLTHVYVRPDDGGGLVPLSNLVTLREFADSGTLNRLNRMRAVTLDASLAPGYSLSEALEYLEGLVEELLPETATVGYRGESLKFKESGGSVVFVFLLALLVVFLVLAAQFESFVHPMTIMLTVPIAIAGGLLGLVIAGENQSIYSSVGLILLVGLATKNGILIVEFINQLRDEGVAFMDAIVQGSVTRLRPIVMTVLTTLMGSLPLVLATGAGAETRRVVGVVILGGVGLSALFTLFVVPVVYRVISARTGSPEDRSRQLEAALVEHGGDAGEVSEALGRERVS
jgi:multidrug efflux pump